MLRTRHRRCFHAGIADPRPVLPGPNLAKCRLGESQGDGMYLLVKGHSVLETSPDVLDHRLRELSAAPSTTPCGYEASSWPYAACPGFAAELLVSFDEPRSV